MAEFRRLPTQQELEQILFMQGLQPQSTQQILQQNLAPQTIKPIPENVFQKIAGGAKIAADYVNRAGTAADIAKLFPGYTGQSQVNIPTSFSFAPKQAPTGEILPQGLQTQQVNVGQLLQAIKPADVLGITGAQRAYSDIGMGKAPQPLDVVDVAGLGALGVAGTKAAVKGIQATKGLPVGMSIQDVSKAGLLQEAPRSPLGFYSALEETALNIPRKQGSGQAFLNDLQKGPNVKAEEIKWIGLDDYLKNKPNVTKQEVQDYIANNRVDVQEVRLGGAQPYNAQRLAQLESEYKTLKQHPIDDPSFGEEKYNELIRLANIRDQSTTQTLYESAELAMQNGQRAQRRGDNLTAEKYFREAEFLNTRAEKLDLEGQGMSNPPKFGQYTLPGGENYREILLTMPDKGTTKQAEEFARQMYQKYGTPTFRNMMTPDELAKFDDLNNTVQQYSSAHFPQKNILAHLRVNDRVDADGKKMLLIEEVQSDWHQAGREKGYQQKSRPVSEIQKDLDSVIAELRSKPGVSYAPSAEDWARHPEITSRYDALQAEWDVARQSKTGVPDAPFKDTWYQLALKRAIQYAAENGYERIGLTTGRQQADRFDLSKQVDELNYKKNTDGTYRLSAQAGGRGNMLGDAIPESKLSDYVGKEVAQKIIDNVGKDVNFGGSGSVSQPKDIWKGLSGIDLKIGGEGMKKYYDEIYPKFLDKYGKKWNAKVGETKIKTGKDVVDQAMMAPGIGLMGETTVIPAPMESIRYLDITPEMKASVSKGQPLFQVGIGAGGGLLGAQQERK